MYSVRGRACMLSCSVVSDFLTPQTVACQAPLSMGFSSKNTEVVCNFLLQRIFPTQGSNPSLLHLLHCQVDSLLLNHLGSLQRARYEIFYTLQDFWYLLKILNSTFAVQKQSQTLSKKNGHCYLLKKNYLPKKMILGEIFYNSVFCTSSRKRHWEDVYRSSLYDTEIKDIPEQGDLPTYLSNKQ